MALASCERRADFSRPCGARFTDLAVQARQPTLRPSGSLKGRRARGASPTRARRRERPLGPSLSQDASLPMT